MQRIVFLMSDTGGGHRAAADAIRAAIDTRYPGAYTFTLVDVYRRYTPFPFRYLPEIYPHWVNRAPATWGAGFWLINARYRNWLTSALLTRWWWGGVRRLVQEHPADVIVCVHPLFARPALRAWRQSRRYRPPFVTVITDLVSTPAFWYAPDTDRCLVPTQAAYERGLDFGLRPEQLRITGLPVHPAYSTNLPRKSEARQRLGWNPHLPVVLVTGGGDGMGPVFDITRELDRRGLNTQLAIVAGRNRVLLRRLEASRWHQPTYMYPYVDTMPDLMAAADILVTKAGPATICEAAAAGLPVVISGAVPGQEDGNVTYVIEHGAGVYAPNVTRAADAVANWLGDPAELARYAHNMRTLARPDAVWNVAEEIHLQAQKGWMRTAGYTLPGQPRLRSAPEDGWVI
jgi:1,2-diacylglycerol 3-beta-galactosyltransferase